MKSKIKILLLGIMFVAGFSIASVSSPVAAANLKGNACSGAELSVSGAACPGSFTTDSRGNKVCQDSAGNTVDESRCSSETSLNRLIANIINILSLIVGIVAVIMIIIGGFKYITSAGDANNISSAKNTIIYAIVGLVIVALAQFIVRFVLAKATNTTTT